MKKKPSPKVQANEVNYELHSLGWKAFQDLCVTIVGQIWGQTVQSFHDSNDGGRDGAFHGKWAGKGRKQYEGTFTMQCKFTREAKATLKSSALKDEIVKAKRIACNGLADNYFLFTNAKLTGKTEEILRKKFKAVGVKQFSAYGFERISQLIRENAKLRMLVPRIYGLGDLSQILDERAYSQSQEILSSMGHDFDKFVITDAYHKSCKAVIEHGFVLLLGDPACGKSTIAAALSLAALDNWGCSTIKIRNAPDFTTHWNPNEKQFFWVDDAFGVTQFDQNSTSDWNRIFADMHAAIKKGTKILFTSRNYIYYSARNYLKESAFPLMKESQVVIHVEDLSQAEREQILYNHIRLGSQTKDFKKTVKSFLPSLSSHKNFSPEIARRLGNPIFTKNLSINNYGLDNFFAKPIKYLIDVIQSIDVHSRAALALLFMNGGTMPSPIEMSPNEGKAIVAIGSTASLVLSSISHLNGSLLMNTVTDGNHTWRFKHPTIRDAFAEIIHNNPELLDIYLAGTNIEKLYTEVSCGKVDLEGVKVIVLKSI